MENIEVCNYQYLKEIVGQKTIVIWWLILYNPTKLGFCIGSVDSDVQFR
jgi:hypothetical protein